MPTASARPSSLRPRLLLAALLLWAGSISPVFAGEVPLRVVTLNTVLTEIARSVGGDEVRVTGMLQPGVNPHDFQPSPRDIRNATEAEMVLASGLHLEAYLEHIIANTSAGHRLVLVGDNLPSELSLSTPHTHAHAPGAPACSASHGERDPHWWHSIDNVLFATELVRAEFSRQRPALAERFNANAQVYRQRLLALKEWAQAEVAQIPPARRLLFTSHDAFGYLARDYAFKVHALSGLSTDGEPNARHMARLIDLIRKEKVKAVFAENSVNPRLISQLVAETGVKLGGTLYADGLGTAESPAATYDSMMRHNLTTLFNALK